jgi:hypothetical protein
VGEGEGVGGVISCLGRRFFTLLPPTDWGEFVQVHDDRDVFQSLSDELPAIDIHNL